jgi:hypothetical protein
MNWPPPDSWSEKRARGWLLTGQMSLVPGHLNSPTMTLTPYAGCSATKLWLTAREAISHPPISTYDMKIMVLAGFGTPRGWCDTANPSSPKFSIWMFNITVQQGLKAAGPSGRTTSWLTSLRLGSSYCRGSQCNEVCNGFCDALVHVHRCLGRFLNTRFCKDQFGILEKQASILISLFHCHLMYTIEIWSCLSSTLQQLITKQKAALGIISTLSHSL